MSVATGAKREPGQFERDQLVKIEADWRCQTCGAAHGRPHPDPSVDELVFIVVVDGAALCQPCARGTAQPGAEGDAA